VYIPVLVQVRVVCMGAQCVFSVFFSSGLCAWEASVHSSAFSVQDHVHGRPMCTPVLFQFRIVRVRGLCSLHCLYSGYVAGESSYSLLLRHSGLALIFKRCITGACDNIPPRGLYLNV
jgi:hypothetical protein